MRPVILSLSFVALAACGSSQKPQAPPPEEPTDTVNLIPDGRWMRQQVGVFACDAFITVMADCREALPPETHGTFDDGMKLLLAGMRQMDPADLPSACDEANTAAKNAMSELCPGVWPGDA